MSKKKGLSTQDHLPHYHLKLTATLPADPPWREEGRGITRYFGATSPDGLWQQTMRQMFEILGMQNDRIVIGAILNLVNTFGPAARELLAVGIIDGLGLMMEPDPENPGNMIATLGQVFDTLKRDGEEQKLASGIVLPEGVMRK